MSAELSIAMHCEGWATAVPDAESLCCRAVEIGWQMAVGARAAPSPEITLVLTDDGEVARLNQRFRGIEGPTNVLSFPAEEGVVAAPPAMLGDIVIALETITGEAARDGKRLDDHMQHMVVHGLLHLLGYDHHSHCQATAMESLEVKILRRLGVPNPYADQAVRT